MSNDWRSKMADSAVDFALNAFWVAVWGAVVTAAVLVVGVVTGLPVNWLWALSASLITFAFLLAVTWVLPRVSAKQGQPKKSGRRGLLDFINARDRAAVEINKNVGMITTHTTRIGDKAGKHGLRMDSAKRVGWRWLINHRVRAAARDLRREGVRMGIYAERLEQSTSLFIENTTNWLQWMRDDGTPVERDQIVPVLTSFRNAVVGALPNIRTFRATSDHNRRLSADLDLAGEAIVVSLDQVIASLEKTAAFCDAVLKSHEP